MAGDPLTTAVGAKVVLYYHVYVDDDVGDVGDVGDDDVDE